MNEFYVKLREKMPVIKHYALSSLITFLTGFSLTVAAQINTLNLESLENGAAVALIITALRAGLKMLIETAVSWLAAKKNKF